MSLAYLANYLHTSIHPQNRASGSGRAKQVGSALRLATVFPARDLELLGSLAQAWAAAMAGRSAVNLIVTSVRTVPMAVGCDHSLD